MSGPPAPWFRRHARLVTRTFIVLLLAVIGVESFLLYVQGAANQAARSQSERLLTTFLAQDTVQTAVRTTGVPIRLANVRFRWSDRVYIDTPDLAVRATPLKGTIVDFDHPESFLMNMEESVVRVRTDVLEGMLNESIFNYPESKLRDLKLVIKSEHEGDPPILDIKGSMNMVLWLPFHMHARLSVDRATNTLVMDGSHFRLLGILPVTKLLKLKPLQLQNLLTAPPNKSLFFDENRILVKPFGLFPPPRINGRIAGVSIDPDGIRLTFAGKPIPAPESAARNYVYLRGGASQFGSFCMQETDILILDKDPSDSFVFSLKDYADLVPASTIEVHDLHRVKVTMPDYRGPVNLAAAVPAK